MRSLMLLAYAGIVSAASYSLVAFAPDTKVNGATLNAVSQSLYTGTSGPATYCPSDSVPTCPDVQGTLVSSGLTHMAVKVPQGQQVYVAPSGQIKYTMAHSGFMPKGSFVDGWFNKTVVQDCGPTVQVLDWLATDGSNSGGVVLCPKVAGFLTGTGASYALYARTPQFNVPDCVPLVGLVQRSSNASYGAWQYM